jgi:hypothetical protein
MSSIHAESSNGTSCASEEKCASPHAVAKPSGVAETSVEISVGGLWRKIPALSINGAIIISRGTWLRMAFLHDEDWQERELQDPELCVQTLKRRRETHALRADIFSFGQRPPATTPRYSYYSEWDSVAAIPITTFKSWWDKLPQVTRKNVRRSQKRGVDVQIRELDNGLIRDIVDLTKDSPIRQGRRFIHYGKSFAQTKRDQSTHLGYSDFICAYSGDELIGLLKIVYGDGLASVLQFLPKASQQDKRPANALIAKAVEICEAKKIPYLIFGHYQYGNKRHSSLLEFKVRNGFQEILVPRYYVPLTIWGALCLKLKLHRGIIGVLPDNVLRRAVAIRAKWYGLATLLGRRSSIAEQPNRIRQTERSNPPAGSNPDSEV